MLEGKEYWFISQVLETDLSLEEFILHGTIGLTDDETCMDLDFFGVCNLLVSCLVIE